MEMGLIFPILNDIQLIEEYPSKITNYF